MLRIVHRQEENSGVLRMATEVRESGRLRLYDEWHMPRRSIEHRRLSEMMWSVDQVIVGTNRLRHQLNREMRIARGFLGPRPLPGEKLMAFRNNHSLGRNGLLNGTTWKVLACGETKSGKFFDAELESMDEPEPEVIRAVMHKQPFVGGKLHPEDEFDANKFEFGYAVTCHKAQGSQWDKVLVFDDWSWSEDHARWLYTGITRAAKEARVIAMGGLR
jgi:exodeoxyribonuclease-5